MPFCNEHDKGQCPNNHEPGAWAPPLSRDAILLMAIKGLQYNNHLPQAFQGILDSLHEKRHVQLKLLEFNLEQTLKLTKEALAKGIHPLNDTRDQPPQRVNVMTGGHSSKDCGVCEDDEEDSGFGTDDY